MVLDRNVVPWLDIIMEMGLVQDIVLILSLEMVVLSMFLNIEKASPMDEYEGFWMDGYGEGINCIGTNGYGDGLDDGNGFGGGDGDGDLDGFGQGEGYGFGASWLNGWRGSGDSTDPFDHVEG